ncbi:MAG: ATP-binding SpoIIE family protein phosphatase [Phycisphaerales bacterium]
MDTTSHLQPVADLSQVAEARRTCAMLAAESGFSDETASNAAIVATELASNLAKHAGGGQLLFRKLHDPAGEDGLEILSLDSGPGMDASACMRDGFSTGGTPGNGLGAISRLARVFDIYARPGQGTVALAEIWPGPRNARQPAPRYQCGAVSVAVKGESVCGDSWAIRELGAELKLIVLDGLGHGAFAAEAAAAGVRMFQSNGDRSAKDHMSAIHDALRPTRGAAGAVASINRSQGLLTYCGIGNIAGVVADEKAERHLVSHNGTLGHDARVQRDFVYPWNSSCLLIMLSDGIATRWSLTSYPGLSTRHPSLIAAVLFRDFARGRDDATVVVLREGGN